MKHSESTLRCWKFLYFFFNVFSPSFTKFFKSPRCICRTCRWENYGCHSCKRKLILFVKLSCLISVCNDLLYISRVEDFSYIGRLYIFDTAVTGTLDVTALYDIPYSYVVIKQHMFFLIYSLRHRFIQKVRQKLPETVCVRSRNCFPAMQRTVECRGSVCGCFCRRPAQRSVLCVRIPLLLITSYICKYSKLMSSSYINISALSLKLSNFCFQFIIFPFILYK